MFLAAEKKNLTFSPDECQTKSFKKINTLLSAIFEFVPLNIFSKAYTVFNILNGRQSQNHVYYDIGYYDFQFHRLAPNISFAYVQFPSN